MTRMRQHYPLPISRIRTHVCMMDGPRLHTRQSPVALVASHSFSYWNNLHAFYARLVYLDDIVAAFSWKKSVKWMIYIKCGPVMGFRGDYLLTYCFEAAAVMTGHWWNNSWFLYGPLSATRRLACMVRETTIRPLQGILCYWELESIFGSSHYQNIHSNVLLLK